MNAALRLGMSLSAATSSKYVGRRTNTRGANNSEWGTTSRRPSPRAGLSVVPIASVVCCRRLLHSGRFVGREAFYAPRRFLLLFSGSDRDVNHIPIYFKFGNTRTTLISSERNLQVKELDIVNPTLSVSVTDKYDMAIPTNENGARNTRGLFYKLTRLFFS
eukprot:1536530-Pyramimonas_sp.AAC.2